MVDSSITLRRLGLADAAIAHRLELVAFPEDPWSEEQLSEELSSSSSYYVGAFLGDDLVGMGGVKGLFDADLMTIGVDPGHRRRGIGAALLAELIDQCQEMAIERVFLEVRASNQSAIALYRSFDFEEIGRIQGYYRRPTEDALTMRLVLSGSGMP